ncbi:MAG: uroporphyrin-III C/tetrapyrrole (Corrin/Porphyrin) methyltransferase, rRNA [Candidatus Parcubacteria bacterium]|jgi:16S rRNA (cytidine1402-2'-O)-methyltransferase
MSTLYVVGTPIGNLEDISFRAIAVLQSVDLILCEDTRMTARLLERYGINTPTMSYHEHSTITKIDKIGDLLEEGKNMALVSDAGTPGISDPGTFLVAKIRERFGDTHTEPAHDQSGHTHTHDHTHEHAEAPVTEISGVKIVAVPGASALTSALSIAGVATDQFTFLGFLPHKKGRETLFKEIASSERTCVFYESPHRIIKTLESLEKFAPEKKVTIARELTKMFEQLISGTPKELLVYFTSHPDKIRGEFVVVVS